jgi:hypothetical protein
MGRWNDSLRSRGTTDGTPKAAVLDSPSSKTTETGVRGEDAGKKICGRIRHVRVDPLGLILAVVVHGRRHPGPRRGQAGPEGSTPSFQPAPADLGRRR